MEKIAERVGHQLTTVVAEREGCILSVFQVGSSLTKPNSAKDIDFYCHVRPGEERAVAAMLNGKQSSWSVVIEDEYIGRSETESRIRPVHIIIGKRGLREGHPVKQIA